MATITRHIIRGNLHANYSAITLLGGCRAQIMWFEGQQHGQIVVGDNEGRNDQRFRAVAVARATAASNGQVEEWEIV